MKRLICKIFNHRWDVMGLTGFYQWCSRCSLRRESVKQAPINELAMKIKNGKRLDEKERDIASMIVMAVGQQFYEKTGAMFISGYAGEGLETDGLPETIFITPTYGADFRSTRAYKKT